VDGLPVPGIAISNSPTMISRADLRDRVLVQRSSSGRQCMLAASAEADRLYAGPDRFAFSMPVSQDELGLRLRRDAL
jgi:hypothetical protein